MTRKWFLSLLGISAAGQTTIRIYNPAVEKPKPRNGECPVCGTMAPAYKRKRVKSGFMRNCKPLGNWGMECEQDEHWDGPETITISCVHCRVRFDQDAEKP